MFYKTRRTIREFKNAIGNPFGALSYDGRTQAYTQAVNDYLVMASEGDYVAEFIKKVTPSNRQLNQEISMQLDPRTEFLDKGFRNEKADRVEQLSKARFGLVQVLAFKLMSGRLNPAAESTAAFDENPPGVPKTPVSTLKKWLDGVAENVMCTHVYDAYRDLGASGLMAEAMVDQDIKQLRKSLAQLRKQYDSERIITDLSRWTHLVDDAAKKSQSQPGIS